MDVTRPTPGRRGPAVAMAVLSLGLFMTLLDLTIVNVAIPSLMDGLHATLDQVLWMLNAYSLLYAVLLITAGRLGDLAGPRNLFVVGIAIFTLASALSGLAQSSEQLILARAAQGLGAAMAAPQGLPIMLELFPAGRRGGVFALYGVLGGLAVLAGPTLGGFIVTHLGWRWIFFVNLPVGVVTSALALWLVPDLRPGRPHRLDLVGVGLATLGLLGLVFGLIEGQRYDWGHVVGPITIPEIIGAGGAVLVLFLFQQAMRQGQEPLLPFAVFRDRNFTLMTLVLAAMGFAMLGVYLPLTIYLQSVLGLSAVAAGLTVAPQPLTMMVGSALASGLVGKVGGKRLLIPGLLLFAAGVAYLDWAARADGDRWALLPGLIASGAGLGFVWTPVYSLATRDLRPELGGVASGVINTIQELGGVIAGAAVGALLQNRLSLALHDQAVRHASALPAPLRDDFVSAFSGAARRGLEVGVGQTGAAMPGPLREVAHLVFAQGYVEAMRPTVVLPIAVVVAAALACLAVRARPAGDGSRPRMAGRRPEAATDPLIADPGRSEIGSHPAGSESEVHR
ncbi:MAG TPA: MFS transporter [Candidatus Dormibacteraeota bacterium]|jgi:EmrB/QacA subfamily drug resistance transporter|nr:MFS transporter [Candidatus Dormibacteraeota bacterium]